MLPGYSGSWLRQRVAGSPSALSSTYFDEDDDGNDVEEADTDDADDDNEDNDNDDESGGGGLIERTRDRPSTPQKK